MNNLTQSGSSTNPDITSIQTSISTSLYDENLIHKVHTSHDGAYVYLGNKRFLKDDLRVAFGGFLNPGLSPAPVHKFANPAPLGLSAFALSMFVESLIKAGAMGTSNVNVAASLAYFYGGIIQILTGMWEFSIENTFGGTVLASYGGYFISSAAISTPWFGIESAYTDPVEFRNAKGFVVLGWFLFTLMLTLCTMKSTVALFTFFALFSLKLLFETIGLLGDVEKLVTASGVVGVIVAFVAWYNSYAGVANGQNSYIQAKPYKLPEFHAE